MLLEKHQLQDHCFPVGSVPVERSSIASAGHIFLVVNPTRIKVKIISTFQLNVWSHTAHQCHFWLKQPIKSSRRSDLLHTMSFLCCQGNSGGNNRIMANTNDNFKKAVVSYRYTFKANLEHLVRCLSV